MPAIDQGSLSTGAALAGRPRSAYVRLIRRGSGETVLPRVRWCGSFWCRLRGLMFRRGLEPGEALVLDEKSDSRASAAIHMFFVPFAIATVWITSAGRVADKVLAKPWRPFYGPRAPARYILETHPDFLDKFSIGDELVFEPI